MRHVLGLARCLIGVSILQLYVSRFNILLVLVHVQQAVYAINILRQRLRHLVLKMRTRNLTPLIGVDLDRILQDRLNILQAILGLLLPLFLGEVCSNDELLLTDRRFRALKQIPLTLLHVFADLVENGISEDLSDSKDSDRTLRAAAALALLVDKAYVGDTSKLLV